MATALLSSLELETDSEAIEPDLIGSGALEAECGVPRMTKVQLAIHCFGYRAVEFTLGIAAIAAVIEIAKLL